MARKVPSVRKWVGEGKPGRGRNIATRVISKQVANCWEKNIFLAGWGFGSHLISNILVMARWKISGNNNRGNGFPQPSWNAWTVMWAHEFTLAHGCLVIGYCFFFQCENSLPHSLGMLGLWLGWPWPSWVPGVLVSGETLVPTTVSCPSYIWA